MEQKLASADLTHEMKQDLTKTLRKNYQVYLYFIYINTKYNNSYLYEYIKKT